MSNMSVIWRARDLVGYDYFALLTYGLVVAYYLSIAIVGVSIVVTIPMVVRTCRNRKLSRSSRMLWVVGQILFFPTALLYMLKVEPLRWLRLSAKVILLGYVFVGGIGALYIFSAIIASLSAGS